MKQGLTLKAMAEEIERQSARKDDLLVDTRTITMLGGSELHLPEVAGELTVSPVAHRQIGTYTGIPAAFYDRLRQPDLLESEADGELRGSGQTGKPWRRTAPSVSRHPRCSPGASADPCWTLTSTGRIRDNDELLAAIVPILGEIEDVQFASTGLTEANFYLKAVAPKLQGEVKAGDVVQAGVTIKNSEVGKGSLSIEPFFYRLWCSNGCGTDEATRHYHIGGRQESTETSRVFSDATLKLDDAAFFAKVADRSAPRWTRRGSTRWSSGCGRPRRASGSRSPSRRWSAFTKRFSLTDSEGESVLGHLIEGHDLSAYGALNAVTRASQDVESYDRATELEGIGGQILAMAGTSDWSAIAA